MELVTLAANDDISLGKGAADKIVILRAADFPEAAPSGAGFIAFAGTAADCAARLDAGYYAANQAADFPGEMFYKAQY